MPIQKNVYKSGGGGGLGSYIIVLKKEGEQWVTDADWRAVFKSYISAETLYLSILKGDNTYNILSVCTMSRNENGHKILAEDRIEGKIYTVNIPKDGDIEISVQAGGEGKTYTPGEGILISEENEISVDPEVLGEKQDKLTAGTNITIDENNVISATGGGASYTQGNGIKIENNKISADLDVLASKEDLEEKQDKISDLEDIREGAALGKTALQEVPEGYATEEWVEGKGYLTEHQSLNEYRKSTDQDAIDNLKASKEYVDNALTDKQDKLSVKEGSGIKLVGNQLDRDPDIIPTVDYVDQSISNTIDYVVQQDENEHNGRVAGDNLLKKDIEAEAEARAAADNLKVDKELSGDNGKAYIFNEADGGGAKFVNNDGTESFVGVNDGGETGIVAQIYADKFIEGKWSGAKLDVTNGGIYYTVGDKPAAERDVEANELVVKGDLILEKGTGENSVQTKGTLCDASGNGSFAIGLNTHAGATASHTEGGLTATRNDYDEEAGTGFDAAYSHAEGLNNGTNNIAEHAEGKYGWSYYDEDHDPAKSSIHYVGIGTNNQEEYRKDAEVIMANGDQYILGIGGYNGKNIENADSLQEVIENKQDKLGVNEPNPTINLNALTIGDINYKIAGDATIGKSFVTNVKVGNLEAGTVIQSSMKVADILYAILYKDQPIPSKFTLYYGATDNIPSSLEGLTSIEYDEESDFVPKWEQHIISGNIDTEEGQYVTIAIPNKYKVTKWAVPGFDQDIPHTLVQIENYNIYYLNVQAYDRHLGGADYVISTEEN